MAPGAWWPQYKYVMPIDIDLCSKVNGLGCPILTGDLTEFFETLSGIKSQWYQMSVERDHNAGTALALAMAFQVLIPSLPNPLQFIS
jgi:hypothetical protein